MEGELLLEDSFERTQLGVGQPVEAESLGQDRASWPRFKALKELAMVLELVPEQLLARDRLQVDVIVTSVAQGPVQLVAAIDWLVLVEDVV